MGTLRIAVASSVLGTSLVGGVFGHTTISVHLDEVESTVKTTRKVGHIDVESEFLVLEFEHLVLGIARHKVYTRTDVGSRHELEGKSVTTGGDTVSTRIIGTIESAVLSASGGIGAERRVPGVPGVTVGVT